jgi:uncharacterized protein (TIGR03083 family)
VQTTAGPAATTPRRPALARDIAMRLAADEYHRFLDQLRALAPQDWAARTECPAWDVRQLATHVLGMAEMSASLRVQAHQMRASGKAAKASGGPLIDALTALQVRERAGLAPQEVVDAFTRIAPRAAKGRRRTPGFVRRMTMPGEQPTGPNAPGEPWSFGFLIDVVLTRDTWMHRIDIARAVGRAPVLTADHDGVLVDDVVREWGQRHGEACTLALGGPAGGTWDFGAGGPRLTADAVDFCRSVSGREPQPGLLGVPVPF